MSELGLKCENNASFKQIYTLKLFIAFKMAYSCCYIFGGNLDFPEFLQKSFITSTNAIQNVNMTLFIIYFAEMKLQQRNGIIHNGSFHLSRVCKIRTHDLSTRLHYSFNHWATSITSR